MTKLFLIILLPNGWSNITSLKASTVKKAIKRIVKDVICFFCLLNVTTYQHVTFFIWMIEKKEVSLRRQLNTMRQHVRENWQT